jgi:PAS domain S-box-containing protein
MRVLVVDDENAARYLISSLLKGHGYEVVEAVDGRDALEKARAEPVDIVVSDILMPNMDGYQLCREWKSDPELSKAPLVFYSATYTEPADEKFAASLGADAFFVKPQEPDVLVRLIEEVLERHAASQLGTRHGDVRGEEEVLREYSERLVSKLEQKIVELNKANSDLKGALEVLSDEVEVKGQLIEQLTNDLQERVHNAAELSKSNQLLEAIVQEAPIPVIVVDQDMHVTVWNPVAEEVFGFTREDVARIELEFADSELTMIDAVLGGSMPEATQWRRSQRKDGSYVEYTATMTPLHDAAGEIAGFVAMVRDWNDSEASA